MLHVNDDNNDELFRRAAENYPVKTDSADWESLRAKMDAAPAEDDRPIVVAGRKNYRLLWLLLLLIPLGILENKYEIIRRHSGTKEKETIVAESKKNDHFLPAGADNSNKQTSTIVKEPGSVSQSQASNSILNNTPQKNNISKKAVPVDNRPTITSKDNAGNNINTTSRNRHYLKQRSGMKIKNASPESDDNGEKRSIVKSDSQKQKMTLIASTAEGNEVAAVEKVNNPEAVNKVDKANTGLLKDDLKKDEEKTADKKDTAVAKKTDKEIAKTETKTGKKETKKDKQLKKHFYVGLVVAPDFSTIKLQSVKKTGINYGFIAGYKINNHFSVETGILKDKKFYSSKGQYFSTKNIYLPPNATIEYVDGECNMLEWPLNIIYNFRQREKSGLFVSAGVSSYFMKDESYVYDISHNGYRYPYSYAYKNKSTALFAAINLSAGYTLKLGKIADLRIEPYIKLPVSRIGTGELPIQSGGVMVGLTKTIF